MKIILASKSPRRKELLSLMGLDFDVMPSTTEEDMQQKLKITKLAEVLSEQKAKDIFDKTSGNRVVIGSDCMVYVHGKLYGKPKNDAEAVAMLKTLSNSWHRVVTGLCVYVERDGNVTKYCTHDVTKVKFVKLSDQMIENYLKTGEHKDKAGAYAVQGYSGMFIKKLNGNYSTVIGLPTHKLFEIMHKENLI
ncbi:MAG: septum formation protein Maf [Clostridia bacterium]|nr:septum formation protein Maf [Clostridia bacterium]